MRRPAGAQAVWAAQMWRPFIHSCWRLRVRWPPRAAAAAAFIAAGLHEVRSISRSRLHHPFLQVPVEMIDFRDLAFGKFLGEGSGAYAGWGWAVQDNGAWQCGKGCKGHARALVVACCSGRRTGREMETRPHAAGPSMQRAPSTQPGTARRRWQSRRHAGEWGQGTACLNAVSGNWAGSHAVQPAATRPSWGLAGARCALLGSLTLCLVHSLPIILLQPDGD